MRARASIVVTQVHPGMNGIGGAIFRGRRTDNGFSLRCIAAANHIFRAPGVGELWEVEGEMQSHTEYGDQLKVEHALPVVPKGRLIVSYLTYNPAFDSIGRAKAERLWARFGDELPSVLARGDALALSECLTEKAVATLLANWKSNPETEVVEFLDKYGFPLRLLNKVLRIWSRDTIKKLTANPYRLLAVAKWDDVDSAASKLGIAPDDPRRLIAAVESTLYDELDDHHTVTPKEIVLSGVKKRLPTVSGDVIERSLSLAESDRACTVSPLGYAPVGAAYMEIRVAAWLKAKMVRPTQGGIFDSALEVIVEEEVTAFSECEGKILSLEQQAAVKAAFRNGLLVLTGGAGTGKTTVLKLIHAIAARNGRNVVQMCLAGRAAKRLTDATGHGAYTITRFFMHHKEILNREGDPIVIIDEASMVDLPSFYLLTKVLPAQATVVLVGDAAQLPPIGFGLVFHQLASPSSKVPRVELTRIYRQDEKSSIPAVTEHIRRIDDTTFGGYGRLIDLPKYEGYVNPGAGVFLVEVARDSVADKVVELHRAIGGQILCAVHRGDSGGDKLNSRLHRRFVGTTEDTLKIRHAVGEPVIYGENDYNRTIIDRVTGERKSGILWNGSLGIIHKIHYEPEYSLVAEFDGEQHILKGEDLNQLRHAFAITVHRAQGSQFPLVIIPLSNARNVDRTWIYTAITRAEITAILVGPACYFEMAVTEKPHADQRRVSLSI